MILCLWSPLHPLSKLLAIQDHTQNLEEQLWMGGRREVSIIFYRPVTRSDLKWERSFWRGSVSSFLQLVVARQTRDTDTTDIVDTPVHVSYCLIHDLLCKRLGSKISNFTRSNAVRFFFVVASTNFRVWLFSHIKFCFKPCRRLNGSQETLLGLFLWLDDKQYQITKACLFEFPSCFPPFLLPSPVPLLPPVLLGFHPPGPPPHYYISFSQIVALAVKFKWNKQARLVKK